MASACCTPRHGRSGAPTSAISITATKHNLQLAMPLATRLTTLAALLMSTGVDAGSSKLPADPDTEHLHTDCWVPDYCEPDKFKYKLCKLRLRNRAKPGDAFACAGGPLGGGVLPSYLARADVQRALHVLGANESTPRKWVAWDGDWDGCMLHAEIQPTPSHSAHPQLV